MKLRTKLTLLCCTAIAAAMAVSGVVMLYVIRRNMLSQAESEGLQELLTLVRDTERNIELVGDEHDLNRYLEYYMKAQADWHNILYNNQGEEIYNRTVFTGEELLHSDAGHSVKKMRDVDVFKAEYEGREFICYRAMVMDKAVVLRLHDITGVYQRYRVYAILFASVTAGVLLITAFSVALIIRKMLYPLGRLTSAAESLAGGTLSERVEAGGGRNEVSTLARAFNDMAEHIEDSTRRLEDSEYRKSLMIGNLSHELKTPMTAISGYAETLLTTRLTEEEQTEALEFIHEESLRLGRLSNKMMELLSVERGYVPRRISKRITELFDTAEKACQERLKEKNITIIKETGTEEILTDPDLMAEVLINLLDNAAKASDRGSRIWLISQKDYMEVTDEGIGIPEEERNAVTEPFYMVDKSRSRKSGGAGLGLSLVKLIAERLDMRLEISQGPNGGTRVRIYNLFTS